MSRTLSPSSSRAESVASRLRLHIDAQPRNSARALRAYCRTVPIVPIHRLPSRRQLHTQPYWIALPVALAAGIHVRSHASRSTQAFLHDILWAQYCMYLAVRMKDDLLDGQVKDRRLSAASQKFAHIAELTLACYFRRKDGFWKYYHRFVRTTSRGISCARMLQREKTFRRSWMVRWYADSSSILKIGIAAVCFATGRQRLLRRLEGAVDRLAIGSQILDDVRDILEDLQQGRLNYAARSMLKGAHISPGMRNTHLALLRRLIQPGPLEKVIAEATGYLRHGYVFLERLPSSDLGCIIPAYEKGAEQLQQELHRRRVALLFQSK